jgi:hypothetical protein
LDFQRCVVVKELFPQEGKMSKKPGMVLAGIFAAILLVWSQVDAQHQHGGGAPMGKPPASSAQSTAKSGQNVTVEGWKIGFDVMSMEEHMKHQKTGPGHGAGDHSKTHSLMVTVQDTASKEIISDANIQYMVSNPAGGKETGKLTWSGDHYGSGFSPKEKGVYLVNLRIESGGMERQAVFKYTVK